jgi:RNA-directed DNA polymerase
MHDRGKSDDLVVPAKLPNNAQGGAAEVVEGSGSAEGNAARETRSGPSAGPSVLSDLDRVRRVARKDKDARFTALLHHVDADRLRAAYWAIRPKAAPGVDGVTWMEYGQDLEENLRDLHARVHRGSYRARPSRRVFIPKADGRLRPLGVAALEDKILQRAVVEVLNAIYEADFLGFSYGFRPGRSPHDALDALAAGIVRKKVNWVLDTDFREFFTSLDHRWLERFFEHRIADTRVLRLIQKWMAAGAIEEGAWTESLEGVPQGASASPLLANVYLHYVFDLWAHQWRVRHARGDVVIVRFADDAVVGFEYRDDAERFWADLRDRLAKFSLELNADKTRLIRFGRFAAQQRKERGLGKPETFQFLGFTHICGKTKAGRFKLKRITDKKRMRAKLSAVKAELIRRRHLPIPDQGRWLASVLRGHCNYYAVPDNSKAINAFRFRIIGHWLAALRRRSQRTRLTWKRMYRLAEDGYHASGSCTPGPTTASTPEPKAGAQCVSSARWDLCGGRAVPHKRRPVPTAMVIICNRHSARTALRPRRWKRLTLRLCLV